MRNTLVKYCCEIILLVYIILFAVFRHPTQEWDRLINSDGKAYYAYLTAIFIYHDLQYNFVESYESEYYPDDRSAYKEFRVRVNDHVVNKAFPGLAVLWLPFFLLAHLLTLIAGLPADGYSIIYQWGIGLSVFIYLYLGCRFLKKLLTLHGASTAQASFITLVVASGTNLIYYTVNEGTMTHTYTFALIAAWSYFSTLAFRHGQIKWLPSIAFLTGLIIIIRPVNGLLLITLPFWAGSWDRLVSSIRLLFRKPLFGMTSLFILLIIASIPVILWYLQTGRPLVYSYGEEYFDFAHPRIIKLLFSYEKGWFRYTPVALISFFGLIPLFRRDRTGIWFLLVFWFLFVYISSSWWVWDYTSRFSQRIFIEYLPINAVMLASLVPACSRSKILMRILAGVLFLLVGLNILQYYQSMIWVYPRGPVTREVYRKYFFHLKPQASVEYPAEDNIIHRSRFCHDMEEDIGWIHPEGHTQQVAHSGNFSSASGGADSISAGIDKLVAPLLQGSRAVIITDAWVYSMAGNPGLMMIVDFICDGTSYYYQAFELDPYLRRGAWKQVQFRTAVPRLQSDLDHVKVYFMNHSPHVTACIDDVCIEFLSLRSGPDPVPAVVNISDNMIRESRQVFYDMEADTAGAQALTLTDDLAMKGQRSSRIDKTHPYSAGFRGQVGQIMPVIDPAMEISAYIHTSAAPSRVILVTDFQRNRKSYHYVPIRLESFLWKQQWNYCEFLISLPGVMKDDDEVVVYFWNPDTAEVVHIDDLTISFLSLKKPAVSPAGRSGLPEVISDSVLLHTMEYRMGWKNEGTLTNEKALYGKQSCRISKANPYSVSLQASLDDVVGENGLIRISAYVFTTSKKSSSALVLDFRRDGKSYRYESYYMNERARYHEWEYLTFTAPMPDGRLPGDEVLIYFWNASHEEIFYIDNMKIEWMTLSDSWE
ncbi:MAG: hypothetical protein PHD61_07110 [Bacteroidales bacterium]|nr:hypothetical protein [Lentimicrobiaceae bacterium]MDD5695058.1 hypothetical protein [Bacteroidales bacterium]